MSVFFIPWYQNLYFDSIQSLSSVAKVLGFGRKKKGFFQVRTVEKYVLNKITKHFSTLLTWQLDYKISNNVPVCTIGKFWLEITIKKKKHEEIFFLSLEKRNCIGDQHNHTGLSTSDIKLYCYIFIKNSMPSLQGLKKILTLSCPLIIFLEIHWIFCWVSSISFFRVLLHERFRKFSNTS